MLHAVRRVLERRHHVVACASAREALAAAGGLRPEIAILDVRIPELDGFELLARLKAAHPDLDAIMMTGSVTDLDQKMIRAIREDAFYFIQKPFDAELLRALVDRCLERRRLQEENRAHLRRLQEEMSEARAFQRSMLPASEAVVEGVSVACRHLPSSELAGDIYDYAACGAGRAALLVADVSGHGAPAAMLTGVVKSSFHEALGAGAEPERIAAVVASALRPFGPERYVTLLCAVAEPAARRLHFVNAGHPPGLLWSGSRPPERLEPTGPIVSPVLPGAAWRRREAALRPGDRLLLYTDGLTEPSSEAEPFGEARVRGILARHPRAGAPLLDDLLAAVETFRVGRPQTDDITLVAASLLP
jgi:serine phosphatase RsbU (regulator of sigma subunit)